MNIVDEIFYIIIFYIILLKFFVKFVFIVCFNLDKVYFKSLVVIYG